MARHNKQTSVKNRRMNPPRPASSNCGTAYPEPVGKSELPANFPAACSARLILRERDHARPKKPRKEEISLFRPLEWPANLPRIACRRSNPPQRPTPGATLSAADGRRKARSKLQEKVYQYRVATGSKAFSELL
jgi:hypothetical protein